MPDLTLPLWLACSVDGCEQIAKTRTWCTAHYNRWLRNGTTDRVRVRRICQVVDCTAFVHGSGLCFKHYLRERKASQSELCMVIDCDAPVFSIGYCGAHYHRLRRHGRLELVERPLLTPEVLATLKKDVRESKVRRQRARVNGKTRYRKRDIFERDNWTCHLCGDGIDSTLKYPHRMSASIDHVIPIAYFGPDEPENLAASHLICNLRKGHRVA